MRKPSYLFRKLNQKLAAIAFNSTKSPISQVTGLYAEAAGCGYYRQSELIRYAKIIVVTYAHLTDALFERLTKQANLRMERLYVMIDEAHNLSKLSETEILIEDLEVVMSLVGKAALFTKLHRLMSTKSIHDQNKIASEYEWEYAQNLLSPKRQDLDAYQLTPRDFAIPEVVHLKSFISAKTQGIMMSEVGKLKIIEATPSKKLAKLSQAKMVVFQSGTINIEEYRRLFGLSYLEGLETQSNTTDNKYKCYLATGGYTSKATRRSPKLYERFVDVIIYLHRYSPRHSLVICPSYAFKEELETRLEEKEGIKIVVEKRTSTTSELTTAIKYAREKLIILAVSKGKINEGTEVVRQGKSLISLVIMAGLSFAPPRSDKIVIDKEIQRLTGSSGRNVNDELAIIQEVDQAFGRAVRTDNDRGFLVILDFRAKRYAKKLDLKEQRNLGRLSTKITDFFKGYPSIASL